MKIYLARHGQSRWQIERTEGDWNSPLTPLGHEQAQKLAGWLANGHRVDPETRVEVGAVYSSPLQRAQETAVYTANALQLPIHTDENLAEATFLVSDHLPNQLSPFRSASAISAVGRLCGLKNASADWTGCPNSRRRNARRRRDGLFPWRLNFHDAAPGSRQRRCLLLDL